MQIGVDIGGTFTDIVALDRRGPPRAHEGPEHAEGSPRRHRARDSRGAGARGREGQPTSSASSTAPPSPPTRCSSRRARSRRSSPPRDSRTCSSSGARSARACTTSTMDPETPTFLAPRRRRVGHPRAPRRQRPVLVPLDEDSVRRTRARAPRRGRAGDGRLLPLLVREPGATSGARARSSRRSRPRSASRSRRRSTRPSASTSACCVTAFDAYLGPW